LGDLTELADSIRIRGVLQNLTVVPDKSLPDGEYFVVIGHRRRAAAMLCDLRELPCMIKEMDERTQIETMLLENVQREDLTVYEQAQGFQMMLNLGGSVSDIAERTGFSESTVRRRINLLELDQDKFKEADARGATLSDYAELEKIKCVDRKNAVLEKVGTDNFKHSLKQAIDTERKEEQIAVWREALSSFATEIESSKGYRQIKYYHTSNEPADIQPDDADTVEHFFMFDQWGGAYLYILPGATQEPEEDPAEVERWKRLEHRKNGLTEATKRAYELRKEFVAGVSASKVKKQLAEIVTYVTVELMRFYSTLKEAMVAEVFGVEFDEDNEDMNPAIIHSVVSKSPERALFLMAYCLFDDRETHGYSNVYRAEHRENNSLDDLYTLLEKLGYGMSDEEKALQDGSHELFSDDKPEDDQ